MPVESGERQAWFSTDRAYRYALARTWDPDGRTLNVVGLNPSTADEHADDPTIRRCVGLARRMGCGRLIVTNLFAWRATRPGWLKEADEPVGSENDAWLRAVAASADHVVAAWGVHGVLFQRAAVVRQLLCGTSLLCLGQTRSGEPRHPLYVRSDAELHPYVA